MLLDLAVYSWFEIMVVDLQHHVGVVYLLKLKIDV